MKNGFGRGFTTAVSTKEAGAVTTAAAAATFVTIEGNIRMIDGKVLL